MPRYKKNHYYLSVIVVSVFMFFLCMPAGQVQAAGQVDVGITSDDIFTSKAILVPGELIRLYARVNNFGAEDLSGYVNFYREGALIGTPQLISIYQKPEEVFIDWLVPDTNFSITVKIENTFPVDQNPGNDQAVAYFTIDPDTDGDGTSDFYDTDDDGDGLSDADEISGGTDPQNPDTDGDGVSDLVDEFPLDPGEWVDTDKDEVGDQEDSDDDNDGLYDFEEGEIGTDPKVFDTDKDGFSDKLDAFPLDPGKHEQDDVEEVLEIAGPEEEGLVPQEVVREQGVVLGVETESPGLEDEPEVVELSGETLGADFTDKIVLKDKYSKGTKDIFGHLNYYFWILILVIALLLLYLIIIFVSSEKKE